MRRSVELTRRAFVRGSLAAGAAAGASPLFGQQMQTHLPPGHQASRKGPLVFLDYDQDELDLAYDQGPWAPNMAAVFDRMQQKGALALTRLGSPERYSYGPSAIEGLDLYRTNAENAPVLIDIHGGTWRFGDAALSAYMAETYVDAGTHFIAVDFTNVIETGGDLVPLVQQVRKSVAWVYDNAASFGGDPGRIYVSGHSSGGHLAGVLVTTDWQQEFDLPRDLVKGGILVSGMYDLYPVSLSARREYVSMDDEIIETLSPQRNLDKLAAPLTVAYGTRETPEFQRQSREFAAAVAGANKPVSLVAADGCNHFESMEDMGNPYGVIGRAARTRLQLSATANG